MTRFPTVFVSHGPPTLVFDAHPCHDFLSGLGADLGRPEAILCVSAHWETDAATVSAAARPETIHDFFGFPDALYRVEYAAPGAPGLARRVAGMLGEAGIACETDPDRGLDHGAWAPLILMYPDADIPVTQISIQPARDAAHHLALGRALATLRDDGVLVLGSGNATHNLRERGRPDGTAPEWVRAFDGWLDAAVTGGREGEIAGWLEAAPEALRNHPTPDHYLPLPVVMGAAGGAAGGAGARGRRIHTSFASASLSMAAFAYD